MNEGVHASQSKKGKGQSLGEKKGVCAAWVGGLFHEKVQDRALDKSHTKGPQKAKKPGGWRGGGGRGVKGRGAERGGKGGGKRGGGWGVSETKKVVLRTGLRKGG